MVRQTPDEVAEELKRQELDTDGSESASGTNPVPGEDITADTEEMLKEVIGNEPDEEGDGFNIGEEVNKDEIDTRDKEIDDYENEDDEDLKIERKEAVTEDASVDPYDILGDDSDADNTEE